MHNITCYPSLSWIDIKWWHVYKQYVPCYFTTLEPHHTSWPMQRKRLSGFNTLRPRQNCRPFADDIFKCNLLNENAWISLMISLKFVPKVRINNIPTLVQIMAWCRPDDKPFSGTIMVSLLTHICVTRPHNQVFGIIRSWSNQEA